MALIALDTHGDARATTDARDNDGLLPVHVRILPSRCEQEFIRINVPQERLIEAALPFCAPGCLRGVDHNEKLGEVLRRCEKINCEACNLLYNRENHWAMK